jgi:putative solute:sodium symporter small subunit
MDNHKQYWRTNLRYLAILLGIWFIVGFLFSILLVDPLNQVRLAGFPLGFWFAMQGATIVAVILMFVYTRLMNKLDEKYHLEDD